jgi:hypothetical protein
MKYITESQRRWRAQGFLNGSDTVRGQPVEKPSEPELAANSLKVLVKVALEIGLTLLVVYAGLGLHAAEGKRAVDDLLARGWIKLHRIARKGRGGQPEVVEVLPAGRAELVKHGITPAEKKLKRGGFKHDVYARYVEAWARELGHRYWFERVLGPKAFDFVYEDSQGSLRAIEICLSGSAEWTAEQMLKGATVEGVEQVVAACETPGFMKAILKQIRTIDALGLYQKKILGQLLAEYVT